MQTCSIVFYFVSTKVYFEVPWELGVLFTLYKQCMTEQIKMVPVDRTTLDIYATW